MAKTDTIPVLDLETLISGRDTSTLARAFAQAYAETGFAYVVNHGIDDGLINKVFDVARRFHALPLADKTKIALSTTHRGYIAIDTSTDVTTKLAEVRKPNQSASFMAMREDPAPIAGAYMSGPNQWPDLSGFREVCEDYMTAMTVLGRQLMELAIRAIGSTDDGILRAFETPTIWLRLLHYPTQPPQAPGDLYGSAPHTVFGCLTLLAQDDVGGLEVMTPDGNWIAAPPMKGAFVVNVGDMLHRMSNGSLRSTPHRVIKRTGKKRYSVPFFFDSHVSTVVKPLPGAVEPRFEPIHFGDFLKSELEAGYDAHKPTTESGS